MTDQEILTPQEKRRARDQLEQLLDRQARLGAADVVTYHPPEAIAQRDVFALAGTHVDGTQWDVGDCDHRFPLQSISKVFTYALALEDNGREATLSRVGVEPSGDPFNSLVFDEFHRRPHNPMVNSGALVAADIVGGSTVEEKVGRLLERMRVYTGNPELAVDEDLLAAQLADADRNPRHQLLHEVVGNARRRGRGHPHRLPLGVLGPGDDPGALPSRRRPSPTAG